jgi:hypothetical protein
MEYFVSSTVQHDGKTYLRGDTIGLSTETAGPLLQAGAIQTEPVTDAQTPVQVVPAEEVAPSVGGQEVKTGEPSIDGREDGKRGEATDVSPVVESAPESAPVITNKRKNTTKPEEVEPVAPEKEPKDPSADL